MLRILRATAFGLVPIWLLAAVALSEGGLRIPQHLRSGHAASANAAITTEDGIIMRAWTVEPEHWNGSAVIVLHGIGDTHSGMRDIAQLFTHNGYRVLT